MGDVGKEGCKERGYVRWSAHSTGWEKHGAGGGWEGWSGGVSQ